MTPLLSQLDEPLPQIFQRASQSVSPAQHFGEQPTRPDERY
jgi:hypothetical protein